LLSMKPGTRILSNTFSMGDWEPDHVIQVSNATGYFWTVPANVSGKWTLMGLDGSQATVLNLTQVHQRVGGTINLQGRQQYVLGARVEGAHLHFSYLNADGQLKSVKVQVEGSRLTGEIVAPYGMLDIQPVPIKIEGQRQ